MRRINGIDYIALALLIIGGLNWGLVGLFEIDLVATVFGQLSTLSKVVYTLVGLSALYSLFTWSKVASMQNRREDYRTT